MTQRTLVLIKPDAMYKGLAGTVISELHQTNLKMIGLKLIDVSRDLAEAHYKEHKEKEFFEKLVKHLTGEFHNNSNVIAIIYEGENAIENIRKLAGKTHPEEAEPLSIRGKYGRKHTITNVYENVIHASDCPDSAEREINLWFEKEEII